MCICVIKSHCVVSLQSGPASSPKLSLPLCAVNFELSKWKSNIQQADGVCPSAYRVQDFAWASASITEKEEAGFNLCQSSSGLSPGIFLC